MLKYLKYLKYVGFFFVASLCYGETYYQNTVPGLPLGSGNVIGGLYKEVKPKCSHKISPIDTAKEEMTAEAYNKVSLGISILVISFIVSLAFSNPITHSLSNIGIGIGGGWALIGLIKLFVATYLFYFSILAFFLIVFALVYRCRNKSVLNIGKWFKEIKKAKI
jgi:hypothetical protein